MKRFRQWKKALATVDRSSWHYDLVKSLNSRLPRKACTYYWGSLPLAIVKMVALCILMILVVAVGWFIGFMPSPIRQEGYHAAGLFHEYKRKKGRPRKLPAPWEVTLGVLVVYNMFRFVPWVSSNTDLLVTWAVKSGLYLQAGLLAAGALYLLWLFSRSGLSRRAGAAIGRAWMGACPELVFTGEEKEDK